LTIKIININSIYKTVIVLQLSHIAGPIGNPYRKKALRKSSLLFQSFTEISGYGPELVYCIFTNNFFNKKAQLSLGKTRCSLCSSCCSTDLQGYPKSM